MTKLRAGIIGLGVGEKHIEAFNAHPNCEVTAVCDFLEEKIPIAKRLCPNAKRTRKAQEVLEDPDINIISIASFDNYHFEQASTAIQNGKHVFVEKPLCLHFSEAVELRRLLIENPGIHLSSNLNLRTCPRFNSLKTLIQSGEMGQIVYVEADYLWGRIQKLTDGWRKNMEFYSIIHGAGVHMIDLIMWLIQMKPVEVQCYGNQIATANSGFGYNDFAVILMRFENGTIAKVTANGGCVHPHFHKLSVFGTERTFVNDDSGARLFESCDPESKPAKILEEYPGVKEKERTITSFVEAIMDPEKDAIVSCDDTFETISVCFAAEKAMTEGKPVPVEYI